MSQRTVSSSSENHPQRKRCWWLWFALGFAIAFIMTALVWPMHFYDGRVVWETRLWKYYLLEIESASNSSGNVGPTSGNASAALGVLATHFVIALLGGLASAGIGWATRKSSLAT